MTSLVCVSTRRTSTVGRAQPTLPSTRSEGERPQDRAMPTSVMPYRSRRTFPLLRSVHFFLVGVGRAAEPEMLRRRFEGDMPSLAAACFSGERSLNAASKRL